MGLFTGNGSIWQFFSDPTSWWDYFKNGKTNEVQQNIANQNLEYQKERNEIEDQRYTDETVYNRAFAEDERNYQRQFAEDERAYNRALQQQLFEREDTAQIRQAQQLSSMGINPLSQQLNGASAGSPIMSSLPSGATAPTSSTRGGSALHNDFQMKDQGMLPILSSMLSLVDTVNGVKTGQYNRDSLALANDRKFLENLDYANQLGIRYTGYFFNKPNGRGHYTDEDVYFQDPKANNLFSRKEYKNSLGSKYRKNLMDSMPNWQFTLNQLGQDSVYKDVEKALTKTANLFDNAYNNLGNKENYSLNPFKTLFNMFFGGM